MGTRFHTLARTRRLSVGKVMIRGIPTTCVTFEFIMSVFNTKQTIARAFWSDPCHDRNKHLSEHAQFSTSIF